jgi:hypothetical protein
VAAACTSFTILLLLLLVLLNCTPLMQQWPQEQQQGTMA